MDIINWFIEFVLHMDKHLPELVKSLGYWTYAAMFAVIFVETGLVIMPFLPGDSLLFAAGAVAALGGLDVLLLFVLMAAAAVLGDTVNYWIGHTIGPRAFSGNIRFLKKEYLDRTHAFFEARRKNHLPGAFRAHRAHLCAFRGGHGRDVLRLLFLV